MSQAETTAALLASLDAEQARLRKIVGSVDASTLTARPGNGGRSGMEILQHLLFADQAHLGRYALDSPLWSPLGVPPPGMQRHFKIAGTATTSIVDEVMTAWKATHVANRKLVREDTAANRKALEKNLRHLHNHIKEIERLLRFHR